MYTITKNCSMGDFENCGCDESKNGKTGKLDFLMGVGKGERLQS
jgi:wingless-type MMTV integration site family protein 8